MQDVKSSNILLSQGSEPRTSLTPGHVPRLGLNICIDQQDLQAGQSSGYAAASEFLGPGSGMSKHGTHTLDSILAKTSLQIHFCWANADVNLRQTTLPRWSVKTEAESV